MAKVRVTGNFHFEIKNSLGELITIGTYNNEANPLSRQDYIITKDFPKKMAQTMEQTLLDPEFSHFELVPRFKNEAVEAR